MYVNIRDVTAFRTHPIQFPPFLRKPSAPKYRTKLVPRNGGRSRDRGLERNVCLRNGLLYLLILRKGKPNLLWEGSVCELGKETQRLLLRWELETEAFVLRIRHLLEQLAQVKAKDSAVGSLLTSTS